MSRKAVFVLILLAVLAGAAVSAQDPNQETTSQVAELEEFHEIIYPIWHTAYPEKDYTALRSFVPRIEELAAKIYSAKLPGILRDKEPKWQAGVAEFRKAVDSYKAAARGADVQALLNAAEALHARYEMLVRTIRPVLKEMDEFHKVLYVVFHKDLPEKKWAEIKAASTDLKVKAEAITGASLSPRMAAKADAFRTAAAELDKAAALLVEKCGGNDTAAVETAVLELHAKYQSLEKVFD